MKIYEKPRIKIERFALSERIASGCSMDTGWLVRGSSDVQSCYAQTSWPEYGGVKVFNGNQCEFEAEEQCYTLFSETATLTFSSY